MSAEEAITFTTADGDAASARVSRESGQVRLSVPLEQGGGVLLDRPATQMLGRTLVSAAGEEV
jgi:hypothetical protein